MRALRDEKTAKIVATRQEVLALEREVDMKRAEIMFLAEEKAKATAKVALERNVLRRFCADSQSDRVDVDDALWKECLSSEPDYDARNSSLNPESPHASVSEGSTSNFSRVMFGLTYDCGSEGGGQARGFF